MKFFTGWLLAAGLALGAAGAQAQVLAPYGAGPSPYYSVSDIGGPLGGPGGPYMGGPYAPPREYPGPRYGQGPMLLPPTEVYTVVRESGFSPLGIPQQRGYVYTISVIDRGGDDGRLIIDARTGRIIRFIPAHRIGDNFNDDLTMNYGPPGPPPSATHVRDTPRPPKPVASRTVPVPKASPLAAANKPAAAPEPAAKSVAAEPAATKPAAAPEPVQQSAAAQPKAAEAQVPPAAAVTTGAAQPKPVPPISPTQDMPTVQGLE